MEALTEEALQVEIEATRQRVLAAKTRGQELDTEINQASKRQRLRRALDEQRALLAEEEERNRSRAGYRDSVDSDQAGLYRPATLRPLAQPAISRRHHVSQVSGGESTNCGHMIARGEYVWKITCFSWLPGMLEQREEDPYVLSMPFVVGSENFQFAYNPHGGLLHWDPELHGSLAILLDTSEDILLRYRIYVKARGGDFVQWSVTRQEVHHGSDCPSTAYGPDVHPLEKPAASKGVFGLKHSQLLQSEWVEDDTLTVKFVLEVRPDGDYESQPLGNAAEVPEPTLSRDTQALLEHGRLSDVQFSVQGELIHAHSQVLCSRSEVFEKQLTVGMQESVSKVIVIEDCDVVTFKAFLQFLYTDSLPDVKELVAETSSMDGSPPLSQMQALLAVSHKYQVTRLQRWCEWKLCQQLSTSEVCGLLCQAHLLQAKQLENACLSYMRDHMSQVLKLPAYAELIKKWPQIGMKVSLFTAGVSETEAAEAMGALAGPDSLLSLATK